LGHDVSAERQVLTAPDVVARAAAAVAPDREQRWMLRQPRALRCSYAEEVHGRPDEDLLAEAWMLEQPREVRLSYLEEVVSHQHDAPRELRWMLRQSDAVCRSYAREVLRGD
jgi:hypothetical protein